MLRTFTPVNPYNKNCGTENSSSTGSIESVIDCNLESGNISTPSVQSLTAPITLEYENVFHPIDQRFDETSAIINFDDGKQNISKTSPKRSPGSQPRVKFNPKTEKPILEEWYKTTKIPSAIQLKQFADHLNKISNRSDEAKITLYNVRNWFSYRRVKEKRCGNSL